MPFNWYKRWERGRPGVSACVHVCVFGRVCGGWGGVTGWGKKESAVLHLFVLVKWWQFRVGRFGGGEVLLAGCGAELKATSGWLTVEMEASYGWVQWVNSIPSPSVWHSLSLYFCLSFLSFFQSVDISKSPSPVRLIVLSVVLWCPWQTDHQRAAAHWKTSQNINLCQLSLHLMTEKSELNECAARISLNSLYQLSKDTWLILCISGLPSMHHLKVKTLQRRFFL